MKRLTLTLFLIMTLISGRASAGLIDPREVNLTIGSWTVDWEMLVLGYTQGIDNQALAYSSTITGDGWSGVLSGTYLGQSLLVDYTGVFTPTSASTAEITVTSDGTIGGQPWDGSATWDYTDPSFKGTVSTTNLTVSISANVGTGSITATLDKNLGTSTLTADVTASLLDIPLCGSLADAGLSFKYNQSTGKDQSIGHTSLLCGLFSHESILDQTQLFQQPIPPPPPPPPAKPPQPFNPKLYPPSPDEPDGSTPGFGSTASSVPGYEYMYVANATVPEPGSALCLGGMLAGWWVLLRRRRPHGASREEAEAPAAAAA